MNIDFSSNETWLHKSNPSIKFIILVILFITILFMHNINFMINFWVGVLFLYLFFTGHPSKRLALIALPFVVIFITSATSMMLFGKGEITWFKWGLIHITEESFFRGLHLGFRGLVFAGLGVIFSLTTRPVLLFYSFMQQLKVKPKYAYSFMAAVRMIPIMIEELQTLRYALKVRGVQDQRGIKAFYQKLKAYSIPLLSQSIRRAHRIAVAMEAKQFSNTNKRTFYYKIGFSKFDISFVLYFIVIFIASYYLAMYFPYFLNQDVRY